MRRTYTGEEINESENNSIAGPRPSPFQSSCFFAPLLSFFFEAESDYLLCYIKLNCLRFRIWNYSLSPGEETEDFGFEQETTSPL